MDDKTKNAGAAGDQKAATPAAAPPPLKAGDVVNVLDWTRDANAPERCTAKVERVNSDGTLDVMVNPPDGIEPYAQVGLRDAGADKMTPGTYTR